VNEATDALQTPGSSTGMGRADGSAGPEEAGSTTLGEDAPGPPSPLGMIEEIDQIESKRSELRQELGREELAAETSRKQFYDDFDHLVSSIIRPAMEASITRLRADGGGGQVVQRGLDALHKPRVTLWMSMDGELVDTPRQDENPFLRMDANVAQRRIDVWEGDMIDRQGTSAAVPPWTMGDVTARGVTLEIVAILQRAVSHGLRA